jgi:hypothetical protein
VLIRASRPPVHARENVTVLQQAFVSNSFANSFQSVIGRVMSGLARHAFRACEWVQIGLR